MRRSAKRRFKASWERQERAIKHGSLGPIARALLAFQFQERDEEGLPSENARLGAFFMAEQYLIHRSFMRGLGGGEE